MPFDPVGVARRGSGGSVFRQRRKGGKREGGDQGEQKEFLHAPQASHCAARKQTGKSATTLRDSSEALPLRRGARLLYSCRYLRAIENRHLFEKQKSGMEQLFLRIPFRPLFFFLQTAYITT